MALNVNNGNVRQGLNASPTSRQELRGELEKEWDRLPRGKSPQPASPKSPTNFNLDLSSISPSQQTITHPVAVQAASQSTSNTTAATTTTTTTATTKATNSSTTPRNNSAHNNHTPRANTLRKFNIDGEENSSEENSIEKSRDSARSSRTDSPRNYRTDSPRRSEIYPNSSKVITPAAEEKEKAVAFKKSSPATTPRDEIGAEGSKSPRSPRGAMRELRKKVSRRFPEIDLSKISTSVKEALSPNGTPRKVSPHGKAKEELLALIPIANRNQMAIKILKLQESQDFNAKSVNVQTLLMKATLLEELPEDSPLRSIEGIKILLDDAKKRMKNYRVSTSIDFQQEPYATSIQSALKFIKTMWGQEKGDRGKKYGGMNEQEKIEADLCFIPFFLRDDCSGYVHYKIQQEDGSYKDVSSLTELADYLNQGDPESIDSRENGEKRDEEGVLNNTLRSKYISLFTCQFLTNEFGNLAFGINPALPSAIKLYDDTPLSPNGMTHRTWSFSRTIDGGIRAKLLMETSSCVGKMSKLKDETETRVESEDGARATIETELHFSSDRSLQSTGLTLNASGWNLVKDR